MSIDLQKTPKSNDLRLLDPKRVHLEKERPGWLTLTIIGEDSNEEHRVKPVRTFPITDPDHYISFLNEDDMEVGVLENPVEIEPACYEILASLLEQTYFLPHIEKITTIEEDLGVYRWVVQTNKGPRTFEVRDRNDVRIVSNGHVLIRDIDGSRYHITSLNRMDPDSRLLIDMLL